MGNFCAPSRDQRRREMMFLFYFVVFFIMIRVWVLLIESKNAYIISSGAVFTFLLFASVWIRCRMSRMQHNNNIIIIHDDTTNPTLLGMYTNPTGGLSANMVESLHCFIYDKARDGRIVDSNSDRRGESGNYSLTAPVSSVGEAAEEEDVESRQRSYNNMLITASVTSSAVTTNSHSQVNSLCSICLAEYADGDTIMMLPCVHYYHKVCISEWLLRHPECPLCKQDIRLILAEEEAQRRQVLRGEITESLGSGNGSGEADEQSQPQQQQEEYVEGEEEAQGNSEISPPDEPTVANRNRVHSFV